MITAAAVAVLLLLVAGFTWWVWVQLHADHHEVARRVLDDDPEEVTAPPVHTK